ncbi:MAG TPA: hydantoinase B/oxoprolinase family protein, partial [Dehalococcoidia bacterium]|nr:hydantoinase B/oxoprolinase family protein [Dehalococcoidia bacterium]
VVILNDPYLGGTHLPDVTIVTPIFDSGELVGFLGSRAHQADIGGMSPGSMPMSTEIYQEGLIIPPIKIVEAGRLNEAVMQLICRNVRTPEERRGDLEAQMAAHRVGEQRVKELVARYGLEEVRDQVAGLLDHAERLTRQAIAAIPDGEYVFQDFLDSDGQTDEPVLIRVVVRVSGDTLEADFTGSSPQRPGSLNAVAAVTRSAVYYVVRCFGGEHIPMNEGAFRPVTVIAPRGSILDAVAPSAVAGGNVETSQRIVDVVIGALNQAVPDRSAAASQGTMNNLTLGGADPFRGQHFAYYETMGGGTGAGPRGPGLTAVHSHMSNTMNTPIEALEFAMPFRIRRYAVRRGSGGAGRHPGGDGLIREYEFLSPATVTLLSERRSLQPYGWDGGGPGQAGENVLIRDGQETRLPGKVTFTAQAGDVLSVRTPGGGGWGIP